MSGGAARLSTSADPNGGPAPAVSVQARTAARSVGGLTQRVVQVYVYLPTAANDLSVISASVTSGGQTVSVATTTASADPALPAPGALTVTPTSPTTATLTWTAGDPSWATVVPVSFDDGVTWRALGTVAPEVRAVRLLGLTTERAVSFRVFSSRDAGGHPG